MEFDTFTSVLHSIGSIVISYLFFVLIGHYAIKWNNEWMAGLIPVVISLVLLVIIAIIALGFNFK